MRYDEFKNRYLVEGLNDFGPVLTDEAMTRLRLEAEAQFRLKVGKDAFYDIVRDDGQRRRFHPVREYLNGLVWDGIPRIDTWLSTYGGAEKDSDYVKAVSAIVLLAAVRRVRQPGVKFDEMLILESPQGKNKSTALRILATREDWFSDDLPLYQDAQKVIERIAGVWIVEAAELNGMKKGDVEHFKALLSRRVDRARMAYARTPIDVPRQNIFIGTSNSQNYLRDPTGNRRVWPVVVGNFNLDGLERDVDQLWAEAATREAQGESIRLHEDLWGVAAEKQDERRVEDPFVELLGAAFGDLSGKVKAADVWTALDIAPEKRTQDHNVRVGTSMRTLGFEPKKLRFGAGPERAYQRGKDNRRILLVSMSRNSVKAYHEGEPEPF